MRLFICKTSTVGPVTIDPKKLIENTSLDELIKTKKPTKNKHHGNNYPKDNSTSS